MGGVGKAARKEVGIGLPVERGRKHMEGVERVIMLDHMESGVECDVERQIHG